ncbi:MAG TPA: AbrB/MazE/SpoVT family DNA-binding domain-containing protein [Coleofasciculaceae cyanobacterium]|jgi:antitoxin MazE
MEIELRKWGNSIGLRIPSKIAQSLGVDENSVVELSQTGDKLIISKKSTLPTLDEMLASIPDEFEYPEDVADFVGSEPEGNELL